MDTSNKNNNNNNNNNIKSKKKNNNIKNKNNNTGDLNRFGNQWKSTVISMFLDSFSIFNLVFCGTPMAKQWKTQTLLYCPTFDDKPIKILSSLFNLYMNIDFPHCSIYKSLHLYIYIYLFILLTIFPSKEQPHGKTIRRSCVQMYTIMQNT